ncbi:MAG TPA: hypothetical protein P5268_09060 [Candidatus Marinimicrobia bacterium]|nr:hypothetical protein [Candidatus Neomarinimicrobiota bacterium]
MINEQTRKKLLEKILQSKEFSSSKIYASYLTYLVEAAEKGKKLKEISIAIEFFGKDANFNPAEDTIVRTHTYNLRKKLQNYYYDEGKDDKYRLRIPKGQYEVTFVPALENTYHPKRILRVMIREYKITLIVTLVILLIIAIIYNFNLQHQLSSYRIIDKQDPIWSEYLQSKQPVLIVLGNHFFFDDYSEKFKSNITIRHGRVNSYEDFNALQSQFPENVLKPSDEPYFPYHSIWSLPPVLSILNSVGQKPILRMSSLITPQTLGEYNIIFLGSIKTLYILKHTLSQSHFSFEILPHIITYTNGDSSRTFQTNLHSTGLNEDLVLAVKLPGPADNSIFIIASYHSLGAPEVVNQLTQTNFRKQIEQKFIEKYGYMPHYFEILFRVNGIDKTAYSTEMLIFNEITKD